MKLHPIEVEHRALTRRYFMRLGAVGAGGLLGVGGLSGQVMGKGELEALIEQMEYLTVSEGFRNVERAKPLPYKLPEDEKRAAGMTRDTWQLEVIADAATKAEVDRPMTKANGLALDFAGLMEIAKTKAVRFAKVMTCNNIDYPLGMGLWEGVPLREVIRMAEPRNHIRRVWYEGFHNHIAKQEFHSSLSVGRVLEDPPGLPPVILCYKLNGLDLTGERGGPVRMIVPESYGYKSVKWLTHVMLSDDHRANDTYADKGNDIDSQLKTIARFFAAKLTAKAGERIPITGVSQVGMNGLAKVQYLIKQRDEKLDADDPYLLKERWLDAEILDPPEAGDWGGGLPGGVMPERVHGFKRNGEPRKWPMAYTNAHWAVLADGLAKGDYHLRARSVDEKGQPQPLPREFGKSGKNALHRIDLKVS